MTAIRANDSFKFYQTPRDIVIQKISGHFRAMTLRRKRDQKKGENIEQVGNKNVSKKQRIV